MPPGNGRDGKRASTSNRSAVPASASAISSPASVVTNAPCPEKPCAKKIFPRRPIWGSRFRVTATAPPRVKDDILAQLDVRDATVVDIGLQRPNLRYHVVRAQTERKKRAVLVRLLERMLAASEKGCGIVYAATVKNVEALAAFLQKALELTFFPELYAVRTEIGAPS